MVRFQSILTRGSSRRLPRRLSTNSGWLKKILTTSWAGSGSILTMVKFFLGSKPSAAVDLGRSWAAAGPRAASQASASAMINKRASWRAMAPAPREECGNILLDKPMVYPFLQK